MAKKNDDKNKKRHSQGIDTKHISQTNQDFLDYVASPLYRQRLNNFYGPPPPKTPFQKLFYKVNPEGYRKKYSFNPIQIQGERYQNALRGTQNTKIVDSFDDRRFGQFDPVEHEISFLPQFANKGSTYLHELAHASTIGNWMMPKEYEYIKRFTETDTGIKGALYDPNLLDNVQESVEWNAYLQDPSEIHARINSLRGYAKKHGIHKRFGENFTEDQLYKIFNEVLPNDPDANNWFDIEQLDRSIRWLDDEKTNSIEDEEEWEKASRRPLLHLLNTIADAGDNQAVDMAKYGGYMKKKKIKKYPDGGNTWTIPGLPPIHVPDFGGGNTTPGQGDADLSITPTLDTYFGSGKQWFEAGGTGFGNFNNVFSSTFGSGFLQERANQIAQLPVTEEVNDPSGIGLKSPNQQRRDMAAILGAGLFFGRQGELDYLEKQANKIDYTPIQGFQGNPNYKHGGKIGNTAVNGFDIPTQVEDYRDTLNSGQRPVVPIQTEKGEYLTSPFGDIVQVNARKKHKNMKDSDVTDITAEGNYVLSNNKAMTFKRGGSVGGVKLDDIVLGMTPTYYSEGKLSTPVEEIKFMDMAPKKNKFTPAEFGNNIRKKFPTTERTHDGFAKLAIEKNKNARMPYLQTLIELSEFKKPGGPEKFAFGGPISMMSSVFNQPYDNAITGSMYPTDPLLNMLNKQDNASIYKRDLYKAPTQMGNKFFKFNNFKYGGYPRKYDEGDIVFGDPGGGLFGFGNERIQTNNRLNTLQRFTNDYYRDYVYPGIQNQSAIGTLATLAMNPFRGTDEFLHGNQFTTTLNNAENAYNRSFGAEEAYLNSLTGQAQSYMRNAANATGVNPAYLSGMMSDAMRQQGQGYANLAAQKRRGIQDFNLQRLNAIDTFATRRNAQAANLNQFQNSSIGALANQAIGSIAARNAARGSQLQTIGGLEMSKITGNAWNDIGSAITDGVALATNVASMLGGFGVTGSDGNRMGFQGGGQSANRTGSGYAGTGSSGVGFQFQPYNAAANVNFYDPGMFNSYLNAPSAAMNLNPNRFQLELPPFGSQPLYYGGR